MRYIIATLVLAGFLHAQDAPQTPAPPVPVVQPSAPEAAPPELKDSKPIPPDFTHLLAPKTPAAPPRPEAAPPELKDSKPIPPDFTHLLQALSYGFQMRAQAVKTEADAALVTLEASVCRERGLKPAECSVDWRGMKVGKK